ncbi:MAG: PEP-CTERM-box response regulator transcription factor [Rhodospirillales bacterium]|nr:MAG: PEP-CTERM-box response regulator transcription factor [Rhodospirillales bacterium]
MDISGTLLIVDDDEGLRRQLEWALDEWEVITAGDRLAGMEVVRQRRPPVVLLDLGLPPDPDGPTEGVATLEAIMAFAPATKVIVVSGQTQREYAVQAVARGAYDFYSKPIEIEALRLIVQRAFHLFSLEEENRRLTRAPRSTPLPGILTTNNDMLEVCDDIRKFAATDVSVLILGESGTGKELLARATHQLSRRADRPFIAINCAAIPENLIESELFGHERGAFTGAVKTTMGKVEMAESGTLFLDEIGDLPLPLQAKLFRFLQERKIERVGGRQTIAVDIRIVSATNSNLREAIAKGRFREELFYRLSEASVSIPPLRERPDDTVMLALHFLREFANENGRPLRGFSPDALAAISQCPWRGNVRELENRVKRAVVVADGPYVTVEDLDLADAALTAQAVTLKDWREQAEVQAITRAMSHAGGNISKAAKLLDVGRPTLYQLLRKHGIETSNGAPRADTAVP